MCVVILLDERFVVSGKSRPTRSWEGDRDELEPLMKRISKRELAMGESIIHMPYIAVY